MFVVTADCAVVITKEMIALTHVSKLLGLSEKNDKILFEREGAGVRRKQSDWSVTCTIKMKLPLNFTRCHMDQ